MTATLLLVAGSEAASQTSSSQGRGLAAPPQGLPVGGLTLPFFLRRGGFFQAAAPFPHPVPHSTPQLSASSATNGCCCVPLPWKCMGEEGRVQNRTQPRSWSSAPGSFCPPRPCTPLLWQPSPRALPPPRLTALLQWLSQGGPRACDRSLSLCSPLLLCLYPLLSGPRTGALFSSTINKQK